MINEESFKRIIGLDFPPKEVDLKLLLLLLRDAIYECQNYSLKTLQVNAIYPRFLDCTTICVVTIMTELSFF